MKKKTNILTFFQRKVKAPYEYFCIFLSFMNTFSEAAVRKWSSKYVLNELGELGEKILQQQVFYLPSLNIRKFCKEQLLYRTSQVAAFAFF